MGHWAKPPIEHCVQSYFDSTPIVLYWVAVTHVSAVFNPWCRNGSRWLFNFRRPSTCQSSASPRVLRLLSLRCRFVPSKFCFGLQSAWSHHLCINFFLPRPAPLLQIKTTSIWVHHILRLNAFAQRKKLMPNKNLRTLCNFTKHLHPNFPEPYQVPAPEPSRTSPAICTGTLQNLTRYLHRNPPKPHKVLYLHRNPPEPHQVPAQLSRTLPSSCAGTLRNLTGYLHWNPLKPHQVSAPEPSRTSPGICTGTLRNLNTVSAPDPSGTSTRYLHRTPPEPHRNPPEPHRNPLEPCGTSPGICTRTLRNLTRYLRRNPPELHQISAPEPSGTPTSICTGTFRNPPERSGTLQNLARNPVLKLHRIAPELILAKDPIEKFFCWGTNRSL